MGETWLTTTTSASARAPAPAHDEQLVTRTPHPDPDLGQGLAAGGPERGVGPPSRPQLGGDGTERPAFELAVVHLDPPFVDLDRHAQPERLGGVTGPPERAGHEAADGPSAVSSAAASA